jgi:hypothetical protein
MKIYYINTIPRPDGFREVHAEGCPNLASFVNRDFLGHFYDARNAIKEAQQKFPDVACCAVCIPINKEV